MNWSVKGLRGIESQQLAFAVVICFAIRRIDEETEGLDCRRCVSASGCWR